jgi:hypothetical protein
MIRKRLNRRPQRKQRFLSAIWKFLSAFALHDQEAFEQDAAKEAKVAAALRLNPAGVFPPEGDLAP